jgi:hypothetical protein
MSGTSKGGLCRTVRRTLPRILRSRFAPDTRRQRNARSARQQGVREMERIKIEQHSFSGTLWFAAWLFTIGFLHLTFWKSVFAVVLWPYYLGVTFAALAR